MLNVTWRSISKLRGFMLNNIISNKQIQTSENQDDFWYVLRVRVGSEERVRKVLETHLKTDQYQPFVPTKKYLFRGKNSENRKEIKYQNKICFPGYVFVRSTEESITFIKRTAPIVGCIKEAYFFLYYGTNKWDIAMRACERNCLDYLMDKAYNIGTSIGYEEGDYITIIEGPLVGLEGMIIRLDRHKRTAIIKANIMGDSREIKLPVELFKS